MSKGNGQMRLMPDEIKSGDIIELDPGFWTEVIAMQRRITRGVSAATITTSYGQRVTLQGGKLYSCWRVGEERREAKLEELTPSYREPDIAPEPDGRDAEPEVQEEQPAFMGTAPAPPAKIEPQDQRPEPDMTTHFDPRPPAKELTDFIAEQAESDAQEHLHDGTHYVGDGCKPAHTGWPYPLEEPEPVEEAPEEVAYVEPQPEVIKVEMPLTEIAIAEIEYREEVAAAAEAAAAKAEPELPRMPVTELERRAYAIELITEYLGHRPHVLEANFEGRQMPCFMTLRAEDFISVAAQLEDSR